MEVLFIRIMTGISERLWDARGLLDAVDVVWKVVGKTKWACDGILEGACTSLFEGLESDAAVSFCYINRFMRYASPEGKLAWSKTWCSFVPVCGEFWEYWSRHQKQIFVLLR